MPRFFALFLLFAAFVALSPMLARADSASCRRAYPGPRQFPENYADIVERFAADVCEGEPSRDPAWQACILGRLRGIGRRRDTRILADAWNGCMPHYRACSAITARIARGRDAATRAFLDKNCHEWPEVTESEQRCVAERFHRFRRTGAADPNAIRASCIDFLQPCVRRLLENYEVKDGDPDRLGALSDACSLKNDEQTRGCLLRELDYVGVTRMGVRAGVKLCENTDETTRQCVKDALISGHVVTDVTRDFPLAVENGLLLCRASAELRACAGPIARDERLPPRTALALCEAPSPQAAACLRGYLRRPAGDHAGDEARWKFERDGSRAWRDGYVEASNACRGAGPVQDQPRPWHEPSMLERILGGGAPR